MVRPSHASAAALAASQIFYGLDAPRPAWSTRAIVGLLLTTSTLDAVEQRGARGAAVVAAAGSIGFGAELLGVHTGRPFGPYSYSGKLGPKVADVPLMAAAAWALIARPSLVIGDLASSLSAPQSVGSSTSPSATARSSRRRTWRQRVTRTAVAAGAITAWDIFLDPRMVREGYWTWPQGGRYEDVPATNYLGWLATGAVIAAAAELIDPADDAQAPARAAITPTERSGDTALGLFSWMWIGELIANVLLWKRPKIAAAGGLAMGSVAVPALLARLRNRGT